MMTPTELYDDIVGDIVGDDCGGLTFEKLYRLCADNNVSISADELKPIIAKLKEQKHFLKRIGDIEVTAPQWIVKNFLERDSFSCLYGDSDSGKSFLAIALSCCIATGTEFYGHAIKQKGTVLYIAQEGQSGLVRRFRAWSLKSGVPIDATVPLYTNELNLQLLDDASVTALTGAITEQVEQTGTAPCLLVLDTWSRTLGGDDSATLDSAHGVAVIDKLRKQFTGMSVFVVHHSGHDKTRARGWSGLRAAVDTEYRQERVDGVTPATVKLSNGKNKEAVKIDDIAFEFRTVDIGIKDEDGESVTSAVLEQCDVPSAPCKALCKSAQAAFDVLKELEEKDGIVAIADWSRESKEICGMSKQGFYFAKKTLIDANKIVVDGDNVHSCKFLDGL